MIDRENQAPSPGTTPCVLYLGGLGRSGSTLLERMIGELSGACALGELVHLWERALRDDERCGCGCAFSDCEFWQRVGELAFGGWASLDVAEVLQLKRRVDRTRYVPRLATQLLTARQRQDLEQYVALYQRLYSAASAVSGATVVVDSSKHASLAFCLKNGRLFDLRLLQMVRDSPAVAHSWSKTVERPEALNGDSLMPTYSTARVGLRWNLDNLLFDLLRALGHRVLLLRYEDVVQDPEAAVALVASHVGLSTSSVRNFLSSGQLLLTPGHTVAGNPMRFRTGTVAVRADEAWRKDATRTRSWAVKALTLPVRVRLGYVRPVRALTTRFGAI